MAANETEKMWVELAPFYDVIYQWKDYRAESERIHQLIRSHCVSNGNTLLDVACGTGGHTEFLRDRYDITGIDLNREMLKVARRKIPGVTFLSRDMSSFNLNRRFDAVICLFSSIAYVRTYRNLKRTIACFARHLKPGGVLIIEPFFTKETFIAGSIHAATLEAEDAKITRHNVSRRRGNMAVLDFHFLLSTKRGTRYFRDVHEMALFDRERFLEITAHAGLTSRYDENGLMPGRGLYVSVKAD